MNVMDSHVIQGRFAAAGYASTDSPEDADVIILNTCSVREKAENKALSFLGSLRELKRKRPHVLLVVAGCMAQRLGGDILRRGRHVDLVVGTRRIDDIVALVEKVRVDGPTVHTEDTYSGHLHRDISFRDNPRQAYVGAMRGCNNFCAYCIVPHVRGRQVSRPLEEIVEEAATLAADGVSEITLLGQNITAYGRDPAERRSLAHLLEALQEVDGIEWIKFITCHPRDTSEEVFSAIRDLPKVCRYIHMPAQSGSDRVLAAMKRGYSAQEYLDKVGRLREIVGEVAIAGDFIVGFPGEARRDFEDTVDLLRKVGFKNSFIFKYSPRPATAAARMVDDVPAAEKARRNNELLAVQKEVSLAHNLELVGREVAVLVDGPSKKDPNMLAGRTEGEEIVVFKGAARLQGSFVTTRITGASPFAVFGEMAQRR